MQTAKYSAFVFALAFVTSACGDSMSSLNPTAPSSAAPGTLNIEAGAEAGAMGNGPKPANGNGNGNNAGGNGNGKQPALTSTTPSGSRIQLEGVIEAVNSSSITVSGQFVVVTSQTVIRRGDVPLAVSDLQDGDRVHLTVMRVAAASNNVASLVAVEVKLQNPGEDDGEEPPAPTGLVSVTASDASAVEGAAGDTVVFRLTRAGDATLLASSLTVSFSLTGSAVNGTDYSLLPTTATFAANSATADVVVSPVADALAEVSETVVLTLTGVAPYELGSPVMATASIADPAAPAGPTASVVALDAVANEDMDLFDFGVFRVTRTGDLTVPLTVTVTITGTATSGVDYQPLETTVHFVADDDSEDFVVIAFPDGDADSGETVILTVVDGPAYNPGASSTATVTIIGG